MKKLAVVSNEEVGYIEKSKIPLKTHQKRLVQQLEKQRGLIAIHSVGSGKTLSAVTASQGYLENNPDGKIVVITPTSLQKNFKKEMIQYDPDIDDEKYEFYTFESFVRALKRKELGDSENIMLIIDEAHNLRTEIKAKGGKRPNAIINYAKKVDKVLLLTATPIVNETYDLINLIAIVKGEKQMSQKEFKTLLCYNRNKFNSYFKCQVSIFKPDVKETEIYYPKYEINEIFLPMTKKYEDMYLKVEKSSKEIENLYTNPSIFYNGVRRASNKLDDNIDSPKIKWVRKFLEKHQDSKIVFFSHWLDSGLNVIKKILDEMDIGYRHIDGAQSIKKRQESVDLYNSDSIRVLLISKAGGEGLDLKSTRYMILLEPSWNPSTTEQVIGRGIRFKSHYNLPKSEQFVEVYKLFLVKRGEYSMLNKNKTNVTKSIKYYDDLENFFKYKDSKWSVDLYLRALCMAKKHMIENAIDNLKVLSIEENKC